MMDRLEEFKTDLKADADLGEDHRSAANEDMRFINVPGGMWEGFLEQDFDSDRVKLELDLVSNFVNRFIGEWNQNRVGVEYKPDDSRTTDDDAELLNGIYRFDFRKGSGKLATDNAVDEAATCGVGAFKLATVFDDDTDPENDCMSVEWRPIYNAYNTVYWDQSAKRIDKRDARYCTVLSQYTKNSFLRQYPRHKPISAYQPEGIMSSGKNAAEVFIATRYEVVKKKVNVFVYNDLQAGKMVVYSEADHEEQKDELAADELKVFVRQRKIIKQMVEKTVFSGDAILSKTRRIAGKWIPIIPVYGYRTYVDGVETYRGLVRKLKDAARLFNMQVSQLAENAATDGQDVPIFAPEQMQNPEIQNLWANKNNMPYLLAEPLRDGDGNIVSTGPLGYSKPAMLDQSTSSLLSIVPQFVQDVTGGQPQEAYSGDMSGKAINAIIKRENMNTQIINDNIANAIQWSGAVYQSIAAEIYTSKRMVRTVGKDGTEGEVQLLEQVVDADSGKIMEVNDLSDCKFQAYADVGPQYESVRQQTVEDLKGMLATLGDKPEAQQYLPVMLAVLMDNISGVGLDPIRDFNRKIMLKQGLAKPNSKEEQAFVEQQAAPKEDPQAKLLAAAAAQQEAEARSLDASSLQKTADAQKKVAETAKIKNDIGMSQADMLSKQADMVAEKARRGLN